MVSEKDLPWTCAGSPPTLPEQDHRRRHAASPLPRQQRKGAAAMAWLVIPEFGPPRNEELGKHSVMRRAGIPARDLRILDPALSYPSTLLGRERAIVVKLEHAKAIITAAEVLVPNFKDPLVEPFVRELQFRVSSGVRNPPTEPDAGDTLFSLEVPNRLPEGEDGSANPSVDSPNYFATLHRKDGQPILDRAKSRSPKVLPFEFRALEVCLECACCCLETETSALEKEAYPALDELTSKISTLNLQRVRQIKNRLVLLSGRVHKVRDELEHLLDDDMDMVEMHLTEKLIQRQLEVASSMDELGVGEDDDDLDEEDVKRGVHFKNKTRCSNETLPCVQNIEDLEMLLEAYFVRTDGTLNKLSTLKDYVDDTEDHINMTLDDKQNQLLQMQVVLVGATMIISAAIVVVGVLGMNIHISIFESVPSKFWATAMGCVASCIVVFLTGLVWAKRSGMLS
ncbi:hypothetical protein Taro_012868 [Colocasia esculenta]|uniref:Magnesium transporter n=1 Tax=Colocasia esculenta TaxID=4460 RepID=A0A843U9Y4_COLES|nr:hypothetical protein [Colocasia esculenta]